MITQEVQCAGCYIQWQQMDERLRTLEQTTAQRQALPEYVVRLDHEVHGNGHPGLKTRVANLELLERRYYGWFRAIGTALLGLCAKAVWDLIHLGLR